MKSPAPLFIGDVHDLIFSVAEDLIHAVGPLNGTGDDLLAGIDQIAQLGLLVDDAGIVLGVKGSWRCQQKL